MAVPLDALVPSWPHYHAAYGTTGNATVDPVIVRAGTTLFHATTAPIDPTELAPLSYYSIDTRHPVHVLLERMAGVDGDGHMPPVALPYAPVVFEFVAIRDIPRNLWVMGDGGHRLELRLGFPGRITEYLRHVRTFHLDADYVARIRALGPVDIGYTRGGFDERDEHTPAEYEQLHDPQYRAGRFGYHGVAEDIMCAPPGSPLFAESRDYPTPTKTVLWSEQPLPPPPRTQTLDTTLDATMGTHLRMRMLTYDTVAQSYALLCEFQQRFGRTVPVASAMAAYVAVHQVAATFRTAAVGARSQFYVFTAAARVHTFTEPITFVDADHPPVLDCPETQLLVHVHLHDLDPNVFVDGQPRPSAVVTGLEILPVGDAELRAVTQRTACVFLERLVLFVRYHQEFKTPLMPPAKRPRWTIALPRTVRAFPEYRALQLFAAQHGVELESTEGVDADEEEEFDYENPEHMQRRRELARALTRGRAVHA